MTKPVILTELGKQLRDRLKRIELTQDDVLDHLRVALYMDPLEFLTEGENPGTYLVKDLKSVPVQYRRCITKFRMRNKYSRDGSLIGTELELELMSKDALLVLALKHLGVIDVKGNLNVNVDVDSNVIMELLKRVESSNNVIDVVPQPAIEEKTDAT
jgi:hypothetical protein